MDTKERMSPKQCAWRSSARLGRIGGEWGARTCARSLGPAESNSLLAWAARERPKTPRNMTHGKNPPSPSLARPPLDPITLQTPKAHKNKTPLQTFLWWIPHCFHYLFTWPRHGSDLFYINTKQFFFFLSIPVSLSTRKRAEKIVGMLKYASICFHYQQKLLKHEL